MDSDKLRPSIKQGIIKMMSYCTYQERCQKEAITKLRNSGFDQDDTDEILIHLISEKYINEERYAKAYCRGKFRQNKWGKTKIKLELRNKDISDYCINKGMQEIDESEYLEVLGTLIDKKSNSLKDKNQFVRKKKITDYALGKGYEYELILSLL